MRQATLPALIALGVCAGCASVRTSDQGGNPAYWQIVEGEALSHIPDESDALAIWFECRPGRRVWMQTPIFEGRRTHHVRLSSGRRTKLYAARISEDEVLGEFAEAEVDVDDPVLSAFRGTGRLTISGVWRLDAAREREAEAIETFFARCARR